MVDRSNRTAPISGTGKRSIRPKSSYNPDVRRIIPPLELVTLVLFALIPCPAGHGRFPMAIVMTLCIIHRCLPLAAVAAWYGALVAVIGILHHSRGVKYLTSVIYCLLLAASATMTWAPWALYGTLNWTGFLTDPWTVGTHLPFAIADIVCIFKTICRMRTLPKSEWQFTLRDVLIFASATAVFLGVMIPVLADWYR